MKGNILLFITFLFIFIGCNLQDDDKLTTTSSTTTTIKMINIKIGSSFREDLTGDNMITTESMSFTYMEPDNNEYQVLINVISNDEIIKSGIINNINNNYGFWGDDISSDITDFKCDLLVQKKFNDTYINIKQPFYATYFIKKIIDPIMGVHAVGLFDLKKYDYYD